MNYLNYKNQWEADIYDVGGRPIMNLKRIRFDGVEYPVQGHDIAVPYSDMGHTYTAYSTRYFIKQNVLGVDLMIGLNEILPKNRKIEAVDFEYND